MDKSTSPRLRHRAEANGRGAGGYPGTHDRHHGTCGRRFPPGAAQRAGDPGRSGPTLAASGHELLQRMDPSLAGAQGTVEVWVKLGPRPSPRPTAQRQDARRGPLEGAAQSPQGRPRPGTRRAAPIARSPSAARSSAASPRPTTRSRCRIDASRARRARGPARGGSRSARSCTTSWTLSETVPYIGAAAAQAAGNDGAGVRVAVFDSGIDYTPPQPGRRRAASAAYDGRRRDASPNAVLPHQQGGWRL